MAKRAGRQKHEKQAVRHTNFVEPNGKLPNVVYVFDLFVRSASGKVMPANACPAKLTRHNAFILYEPWFDAKQFSDIESLHVGKPTKPGNWWQARLCLVRWQDVGVGYINCGDAPKDALSLNPLVPVVKHAFLNTEMLHMYTNKWPTGD